MQIKERLEYPIWKTPYFCILGLIVFIKLVKAGALTLLTHKKFFNKHSCAIVLAVIALSVPIMIRGIIDLMSGSKTSMYEEILSEGPYWEVVYYGLCEFIPCIC